MDASNMGLNFASYHKLDRGSNQTEAELRSKRLAGGSSKIRGGIPYGSISGSELLTRHTYRRLNDPSA